MKKLLLLLIIVTQSIVTWSQIGPITEICLVTVDTASTHTIVVWERASQSSINPIDSIKVYRTKVLGGDTLVGTVAWDSLSEFHDYSADPNLRFFRYRISGVDNQGVEGPMSLPHQTIHFTILEQGDSIRLAWTPYIGNALNFYNCFSDSIGSDPGWQWVNSTQNNVDTAWWDKQTPGNWQDLCYLVNTDWNHTCTSTKSQDHNSTRSNRATASGSNPSTVGLNNDQIFYNTSLYPNPASNEINLSFSSKLWTTIELSIIDAFGKEVLKVNSIKVLGMYANKIDVSSLSNGTYFMMLKSEKETSILPFVKQ